MTLEELPPVLVLHLKRFVYEKTGGCQKLIKNIEYPVDLEISKGKDFEQIFPLFREKVVLCSLGLCACVSVFFLAPGFAHKISSPLLSRNLVIWINVLYGWWGFLFGWVFLGFVFLGFFCIKRISGFLGSVLLVYEFGHLF